MSETGELGNTQYSQDPLKVNYLHNFGVVLFRAYAIGSKLRLSCWILSIYSKGLLIPPPPPPPTACPCKNYSSALQNIYICTWMCATMRVHDMYSLGQWNWVADVTESQFDRAGSQKNAAQTPSDCGVGPEKELFLPSNANLHASSASLKHGLPPPSFFEWSSFLAHRLVMITHAIVKLRCKKETVESWQQST